MNIETTKLELMQLLLQTQKMSVLQQIKEVFEKDIVAYTVDGRPLTKSAYKKELLESEAQIARGEFITQEDLEKESENW
ncbi:hypothetical protein [Sediminicola luteus]|uniref:Uncharacterized protein n=1 Tax=Sediminicola luteus TaxID=319238 RepID=A0A2A4GA50_9FLAO|nr:hypothetical protein [Sediminicola luteus]PCE64848.1 hypothetical protein B7P33_06685 [Sediminicola luteus]